MMGFCCTRLAWFRHGDDRDVTGNESVPAFIRDNAPLFCFGFRERKTKPSLSGCAQKRGRKILQGLRVEMYFVRVFAPRLLHQRAQAASWQSPVVCFASVLLWFQGAQDKAKFVEVSRKSEDGKFCKACVSRYISCASSHLVCRTGAHKRLLGNLQVVCFALVSGSARQSQVCRGVAQKRGREILQGLRVEMHFVRVFAPRLPHQRAQAGSWQSPSRLFCFGFRERKTKPSLSGCRAKARTGNSARLRVEMHFVRVFAPRLPHRSAQVASWQSPSRLFCFGFRERKTKPSLSGCAQNEDGKFCKACLSRCISFASSHLVCRTGARTSGFLAISKSSGLRLFCFGFREHKTKPSLSGCAQNEDGKSCKACVSRCISCALRISSAAPERTSSFLAISSRLLCVCFALVSGSARQSQACQGARKSEDGKFCKACVSRCISFASSHLVCRTGAHKRLLGNLQVVCFALVSGSARQSQACQGARKTRTGNSARLACRDAFRAHFASRLPHQRAQAASWQSPVVWFASVLLWFQGAQDKAKFVEVSRKSEDGKFCKACVSRCISCASSHLVCRTGAHK